MMSTKDFRETIQARARRDAEYRLALLKEALDALRSGEVSVAMAIIEDLIDMPEESEDPDNPLCTPEQLARMKRVSRAKYIRLKLGLSQEEFASQYGIPLDTLRDWERHVSEPNEEEVARLEKIAAAGGSIPGPRKE